MDKKIIVLNGPPGSGKDTAVNAIMRHVKDYRVNAKRMKFSGPAKAAVHALFGLFYQPEYYDQNRDEKEKSHPLLFGLSPRQAYIKFIEEALKPVYGDDILGLLACNYIHNAKFNLFVFSDSGVADEWTPVINWIGQKNVMLIEIHSPQCTFDGDSRSYMGTRLSELYPELVLRRITNNITKDPLDRELFLTLVRGCVNNFLGLED